MIAWHHRAAADRNVLRYAMVAAASCGLAAALAHAWLAAEWRDAEAQSSALSAEVKGPSASPRLSSAELVAELPITTDTTRLLRDLRRWSADLNVQLASVVEVQRQDPTGMRLGAVDLQVQIKGGYGDIKLLLRELQARYISLAILGLTARSTPVDKTAAQTNVEASLRLRLYGRPATSDSSAPTGSSRN